MKPVLLYTILTVFAICLTFCSDDEEGDDFSLVGTNTSIAALTGNWNATSASFSNIAGAVMETDVVAEGGTVTLNIQSNGRFTLTIAELGEAPETINGRMVFDEDLLVIFFDDDPDEWEYFGISHIEPNLSITGGNGLAEFDLDGDGVDEPVEVSFAFERA